MGGKQLDFNAPLLSVRRFTSKLTPTDRESRKSTYTLPSNAQHSIPSYKSDCEFGELTKPAAVPFLWEQIPGRAKSGEVRLYPPEELPTMRSLKQKMVLDVTKHVSGDRSDYQNVTKAKVEASSLSDHAALLCILNEELNEKGNSDSESRDDVYSDALDTLSTTESFSVKCSASGLSRNDGKDAKLSGSFDSDSQTRELMMSRFLTAAKAMALETPQYVSKKKSLVSQPSAQVKNMVSRERRPLSGQQESKSLSLYCQYAEDVGSVEDKQFDDIGKKLTKICGFFPRICVKNSLSLFNPIARMKLRARSPLPSASEVRRPTRTAYSGPLFRHNYDATHKKKFHSGVLSREMLERENMRTSEPYQLAYSNVSYKKDAPSFHRPFRSGGISPYRNQGPQSPFHGGSRSFGTSKKTENIEANKFGPFKQGHTYSPCVSSQQIYKQGSGSACPATEKILYIDPASRVQHQKSNPVLAKPAALKNYPVKNSGLLVVGKGRKENSSAKPFAQNKATMNLSEVGGILKPKESPLVDAAVPSVTCTASFNGQADEIDDCGLHTSFDQKSSSLEHAKVNPQGNLDKIKIKEHITEDGKEIIPSCSLLQSPLTPPLPKSPSESWLWRTLPSIPLRYTFLHSNNGSYFHTEKQDKQITTEK